jgi:hypothetical protein
MNKGDTTKDWMTWRMTSKTASDAESSPLRYLRVGCVAVALLGCGGAPRSSQKQPYRVRMASQAEWEALVPPPVKNLNPDTFTGGLATDCPIEGEKTPELFEPLVAFAKARLIGKLDRYGLEPDAKVTAKWATKNDRTRGLVITVDARSRAGELVVANWWSDGGHSFQYCIRIVHEEAGTTVLVHEQWSAIS